MVRALDPRWVVVGSLVLLASCAAGPEPQSAQPPRAPSPSVQPAIVEGASDSVGSIPGSPDAQYYYRFRQTEPGSDRFTFQDRDLNFFFHPTPDAIHFQIENRQNRPVEIDWDRSNIVDPWGKTDNIAHGSTRWADRFATQSFTTVFALQRYGDYCLPMSYLIDPGSSDQQLHRPLFPEDSSAPQYTDKEVTINLAMRIEGQPRTYTFRFRAVSVIPR